jgi:hypothetical protein
VVVEDPSIIMDQIHLEVEIQVDLVEEEQQMVVLMKVLHQLPLDPEFNHLKTQELLILLNMVIVAVQEVAELIVAAVGVVVLVGLEQVALPEIQQDLVVMEEQILGHMDQQIQ